MKRTKKVAAAMVPLLALVLFTTPVFGNWEGWTYLGDDGQDPGIPAWLDIRGHGYKVENGLWLFRSEYHGPFPSGGDGDILFGVSRYTYNINIDCRPGGQSGTGVDYLLTWTLLIFIPPPKPPPIEPYAPPWYLIPSIVEFSEDGSLIKTTTQPYYEIGDNYLVFSIGVENMDIQYDNVYFQWSTSSFTNPQDSTQMYEIESSAIPISMAGLFTLSVVLLFAFLGLYIRTRK
ncbi:MAG: hypothetical protein QXX33_00090 [Candidatus Hadarchaeales archaeon]